MLIKMWTAIMCQEKIEELKKWQVHYENMPMQYTEIFKVVKY